MSEEVKKVKKKKKKSSFGRLMGLVSFGMAVYGAVTAVKKAMAHLTKRMEEDNEVCDRKRFVAFGGKREIDLEDVAVSEVEVNALLAETKINLSEIQFTEESVVTVRSAVASVVLQVPAMVRVELEASGPAHSVRNLIPTYEDETLPVLHVKAKCLASELKLLVKAEKADK